MSNKNKQLGLFLKKLVRNKSSNYLLDWSAGKFNLTNMSLYLLSEVPIRKLLQHEAANFL
jgi:hypothetical protein